MKQAVLVAHVWLLATALPLLVRLMKLPALLKLLTPRRRRRPYASIGQDRIVAAVGRRLAKPFWMKRRSCLRLSLMIYHFTRLAGRDAVLHVAAHDPSADERRMHAHAWVTLDGRCLCEPPAAQAALLLTWPPQAL